MDLETSLEYLITIAVMDRARFMRAHDPAIPRDGAPLPPIEPYIQTAVGELTDRRAEVITALAS